MSEISSKVAAGSARRRIVTLRPWQRKWTWWMVYLCIGSGVGIFYLKFFVQKDFFSIWIHPTHPWLIAIHLITAPILIYVIGSLMLLHVIPHFRERKHFWNGNLLLVTFAVYSITGMFLFFLFSEETIEWLKWIHTVSGFVFYPLVGYHWWIRNRDPVGRSQRVPPTPAMRVAQWLDPLRRREALLDVYGVWAVIVWCVAGTAVLGGEAEGAFLTWQSTLFYSVGPALAAIVFAVVFTLVAQAVGNLGLRGGAVPAVGFVLLAVEAALTWAVAAAVLRAILTIVVLQEPE